MSSTDSLNFGQLCCGNEKQALDEFSKFFNNSLMSDVTLAVGEKRFLAHKLILVKSSKVFERMFSSDWCKTTSKVLELVEETTCVDVFETFLNFLYTCQLWVTIDTALPILVLADKYNVVALQNVVVEYAREKILPSLDLKAVFHEWFQYSSKAGHVSLLTACVRVLAEHMDRILAGDEWNEEWISLDKDQLVHILSSSDLRVREELDIWRGVTTWLNARDERQDNVKDLLGDLLPHLRFSMMPPDHIDIVENSSLGCKYPILMDPFLRVAYKYRAMSLPSRSKCPCFLSKQFLMRDYTEVRWEKRFCISNVDSIAKGTEITFKLITRACSVPTSHWDWEFKVFPRGTPTSPNEEVRCKLLGVNVLLDSHCRPVEFLLSAVTSTGVIASANVAGRKTVNRNKSVLDLDFGRGLDSGQNEVEEPSLLQDNCLVLQLTLKPAD